MGSAVTSTEESAGRGAALHPSLQGKREDRRTPLFLLVVILLCLLVFSRTVWMDFVYDDIVLLKEPSPLWSQDIFETAFGSAGAASLGKSTPYYRPLLTLSLALDHRIWGVDPAGFHAMNVLLHTVATALLFFTARRLWGNLAAAGAAAGLFAVHPVQAEAVTWITARGDIICAIFMLASFLAYLNYAESGRRNNLLFSLLLFFGALLTKEMGITLPVLILLHALFIRRDRRLWPLSLYAVPVVMYLGLRVAFLTEHSSVGVPFLWRLYTSAGLVARYLVNAFFPFDLRVFYDIPVRKELMIPAVLLPAALLILVVGALLLFWRRIPLAAFGLGWFLLALLPVSGLPALIQPALMADRYLYVPMIGLGLAFGALLNEFAERKASWLAACSVLLLVSAGAAFARTGNWHDQSAFRDGVIRDAPKSYFGHYFAGQKLLEQGRLQESLAEFTVTLQQNPTLTEAYASRGLVFFQLGDMGNAATDFAAALKLDPANWRVSTNLGVVYARQGRMDEAGRAFRNALLINPGDANARNYLDRLGAMGR